MNTGRMNCVPRVITSRLPKRAPINWPTPMIAPAPLVGGQGDVLLDEAGHGIDDEQFAGLARHREAASVRAERDALRSQPG